MEDVVEKAAAITDCLGKITQNADEIVLEMQRRVSREPVSRHATVVPADADSEDRAIANALLRVNLERIMAVLPSVQDQTKRAVQFIAKHDDAPAAGEWQIQHIRVLMAELEAHGAAVSAGEIAEYLWEKLNV